MRVVVGAGKRELEVVVDRAASRQPLSELPGEVVRNAAILLGGLTGRTRDERVPDPAGGVVGRAPAERMHGE